MIFINTMNKYLRELQKYFKEPIVLEQSEKAIHIRPGNVVDTGSMAVCIGIIVYCRETKEAIGGHFSTATRYNLLGNLLDKVTSRFENTKNLEAYLAGHPTDENDQDDIYSKHTIKDRDAVIAGIKKIGILSSNTHYYWPKRYEQNCRLQFDVGSGENTFELSVGKRVLYKGDIRKVN